MGEKVVLTPGAPEGSSDSNAVVRDVAVVIREGLHARPVMRFVDHASRFQSKITVQNATRNGDIVDGKSAMQMMLLEATVGNVLRISAIGQDAKSAVDSLVALVEAGFDLEGPKAAV